MFFFWFSLCVNKIIVLSNSERCLNPNFPSDISNISVVCIKYLLKTETPSSIQYRTFFCVSILWRLEKAADALCTDDKALRRGVQRLDLLSCGESRCFTVCSLFGSLTSFSAVPLLGARSDTPPALDLKRNIGSTYYPRLVKYPVRKYYLIHEWTCLFIECHHDAWYLLHQSPLCMFTNNPSLS